MTTGPDPATVHTRDDLAAALTAVRNAAGLTVRQLADRLDKPSGTLGGYFSGRHLPSSSQLPTFGEALRACGVMADDLDAWFDAVRRAKAGSDRRIGRPSAPYRGLAPFEATDAALFFGRDTMTREILDRIAALATDPGPSAGVLAVVGPSGSGKSSLLRAGVAAAVFGGVFNTPDERWRVTITTPADYLRERPEHADGPELLVVDQLEQVFTASWESTDRRQLLALLAARPRRVVLALGLRADFYAEAAREPVLLAALRQSQIVVGPMDADEVREAILAPAESAGASVEDGLIDILIADLAPRDAPGSAYDAGALPLLSHALLAAWDRSNGRRMAIADYRATGGIEAAVQRTAEDLYASFAAAEQDVARRLLLRLVTIDNGVAITRRRIGLDELHRLVADGADVDAVVDGFVQRRLISTGDASVELSHEALLSAWPRLREWIETDRAGLRLHRQITESAVSWDEAARDPGLLLRGARLAAAADWAAVGAHSDELDGLEQEYIRSGLRQETAEHDHERRRDRRLRRQLLAVAALALVVVGFAAYSVRARTDTDRARRVAATAEVQALSRQLASASATLNNSEPALAQQFMLAAYLISPTVEARSALIDRTAEPTMTRLSGTSGPTPLTLTPDHKLIAVGSAADGSVHLYAVHGSAPPVQVGRVPGPGGNAQLFALAFSPDGHTLVTGGEPDRLRVWDVSRPAHPRQLASIASSFTGDVQSVAIAPDGRTLAVASVGPHPVLEWNITDLTRPRALPPPRGPEAGSTMHAVAFSPDGSRLAAGGEHGVFVWPAQADGAGQPMTPTIQIATTVYALAFDPAHPTLYAGDESGTTTGLKLTDARLPTVRTFKIDTGAFVNALTVSPDGTHVTAGGSDDVVRQWRTSGGRPVTSTALPGPVTGVDYFAGGTRLLATASDGALREWSALASAIPISGTAFNVGFASNGSRLEVATSNTGGSLRLWDVHAPGRPVALGPSMVAPLPEVSGSGAIRADGKVVAAGNEFGDMQLWDVTRPRHPRALGRLHVTDKLIEQIAFSPDGRLMAVASDDHGIDLVDAHDPEHPRALAHVSGKNLMLNVAFSPDGRFIVGANADDHAYIWNVTVPRRPRRVAVLGGFSSYVYGVAYSPDGRLLAATSSDRTTRLWDVTRPSHPMSAGPPLTGAVSNVNSASFSADSRLLAVGTSGGAVLLYDLHAANRSEPMATLRGLQGNVWTVAFSPHGRTLVAGGRDVALQSWTVDVNAIARYICAAAGSPITRAEWKVYLPSAPYDPPCRNGRPTN